MNSTYTSIIILIILIIVILVVLFAGSRSAEGYWYGSKQETSCAGLDERECVLYPNCIWHIDRTYRNDIEGTCIPSKDLPQPLRRQSQTVQRSWWQPLVSWLPGFGGYITYQNNRYGRQSNRYSGRQDGRNYRDQADLRSYYDHLREQEMFYNRYYGQPPVYYGPRYYYSDQQPAPWRRSSYLTAHYLA